jgi:hypothetical protein
MLFWVKVITSEVSQDLKCLSLILLKNDIKFHFLDFGDFQQ